MPSLTILPGTVAQSGTWDLVGGASSILDVCKGNSVGKANPHTQTGTYALTCTPGPTITVNGVQTDINHLPVGFNLTALSIFFDGLIQADAQPYLILNLTYNGQIFWHRVSESGNVEITAPVTGILPDFTGFFFNSWALNVSYNVDGTQLVQVDGEGGLNLTGTYQIISGSFTIPSTPVKIGDQVSITATANLDQLALISLQYVDPKTGIQTEIQIPAANFIIQTPTLLTFIVPSNLDPAFIGEIVVAGVGIGGQFSGYVMLGNIIIYIADGSGIYVLVPGKSTDTIYGVFGLRFSLLSSLLQIFDYDEEATDRLIINLNLLPSLIVDPLEEEEIINDSSNIIDDGVSNNLYLISNIYSPITTEVKIPDPFIKTGFLP